MTSQVQTLVGRRWLAWCCLDTDRGFTYSANALNLGWIHHSTRRFEQVEQLYIDRQAAYDQTIGYRDTVVHEIQLLQILVELESAQVDLVAWEEVDRSFLV